MITINTKTHSLSNTEKLKSASKRDKTKGVKFSASGKAKESSAGESTTNVADISGLLFLQEVDQLSGDQQNLEEFGKKAFRTLEDLRNDLLIGQVSERRLHNLKDTISSNKFIINTPELSELAAEISLRLEVEIAKLEMHRE